MTSHLLVTTFSRAPQHYGLHDDEIATLRSELRRGLRPGDRRLADDEEPAPGSHLVTPRLGFAHHGIYVGGACVVHYGAFVHGLHRGPVQEVPLARFTHGHTLWVRPGAARFDSKAVIRRAQSRIGEDNYRLLSNNCEHFCEWCLRGEPRSEQVDRALVLARQFARGMRAAAIAMLAVSAAPGLWG